MSVLTLKILALVTMIIDHIGAVFFPQYQIIRMIGRLSFPIYAFLIAEGFTHTKSRLKYFLRLLGFGIISEIPYDFLLYGGIFTTKSQNIMFELAVGVLVLLCAEKIKEKKYLFVLPCVALVLLTEMLNLSYGLYGMMLMLTAYIVRNRGAKIQALWSAGMTIIFYGTSDFALSLFGTTITIFDYNSTQCLAVLAALPLMLYNGERGKHSFKWFFYIIYPLHLGLLILAKCIIKI